MFHFIFNLNEISHTESHRCFLNVFENPHPLKKKRYLQRRDVPICHVMNDASKQASELINIDHVEVGNYLIEDSFKIFNYAGANQYLYSGNHTPYHHSNVIVTGLFLENNQPLWYGHRLSLSATEIQIFEEDNVILPDRYLIKTEVDYLSQNQYLVICHSLENDPKIRFVKYKLGNKVLIEVLNRSRLFNRSFDFIDKFYSPISKQMCLYRIRKEKSKIRIELPEETQKIAIKEYEYSIKGDIPEYQFANEPWHLEIPHTQLISERYFDVKEFDEQYFDYGKPYKKITNDVAIVQGSHLIRVSHEEIQSENIEILLYKEDSSIPDLLITNNISLQNKMNTTYQKEWEYDSLSVSALDKLIYVQRNISEYSFAKVTYKIRSYSFIDERLNLNPFMNSSIIDKKVVYYLDPDFGVVFFVLDKNNFVSETSEPFYETWIGKQYDIVSPNTTCEFGFFFYLGSLLKKVLDDKNAILLATVHEPRYLEEFDGVIKAVRRQDLPTLEEAYYQSPHLLPRVDNEVFENVWSIPELKETNILRLHWTKLKDYVSNRLFTKKALEAYLEKRISVGEKILLIEEGCPLIECTEVDLSNNKFKIQWIPPLQKEEVLEATVYTSADNQTFSALTVIDNLIFTKHLWVTFSAETIYLKMKPRITIDGDTYFGPESNVICVSKKEY